MTPAQAEVAQQIERAYPGYHVFVSDEGHWYATRARSWARGSSATLSGASPDELTWELAAEDTAATCAHQAALAAP